MSSPNRYAPVSIPTLNRYKHFRDCLESLEKCNGAEYTEVYVGVDYPPSPKYIEGWEKINEYLDRKIENNNFLKLVVFKREKNCGVCNPNSNSALLHKYLSERYDRFISSEDDNVFAKTFLDYMNQGLEKYKNDPKCTAICGYNYYGVHSDKYDKNVYLSHEYSALGSRHLAKETKIFDVPENKGIPRRHHVIMEKSFYYIQI